MPEQLEAEVIGNWEPQIVDSQKAIVKASNPIELLQMAIEKDLDTDKLEKLMDLQERWEKKESFLAYTKAMNACQAELPAIIRTKENKHTKSNYADLGEINRTIKPTYTKWGFSLSFNEADSPLAGHIRQLCDVHHVGGHTEHFRLDMPLDGQGIKGGGNMTAIHGKASSDTYSQRYMICKIFNLILEDADKDGNVETRLLNQEEQQTIRAKMKDCENIGRPIQEGRFFALLSERQKQEIHTLDEVQVRFFPQIVSDLDKAHREAMKRFQAAKAE